MVQFAVRGHNAYDHLTQLTQPTLVLIGTEDLMAPTQNSRLTASRIANARVIEYPGGHAFVIECGAKVVQDIAAFLHEVDQAATCHWRPRQTLDRH